MLYDTKVTAERVNFYEWKRSSSSTAYYSFNYGSSHTYIMAAMKSGYRYTSDWNVTPPATKDWFLSARSYTDVKFLLVTDQSSRADHPNHERDANTLALSSAELWFGEEHGIMLVKHVYKGDYIRSSTDCESIADEVRRRYGQPSGVEAMMIMVGRHVDLKYRGESSNGCAPVVEGPGRYYQAWIVIKEMPNDTARLSMHEISHIFGLSHVWEGLGNPITDYKTVMHKYFDDPMSIKNWSPREDDKLEANRGWY